MEKFQNFNLRLDRSKTMQIEFQRQFSLKIPEIPKNSLKINSLRSTTIHLKHKTISCDKKVIENPLIRNRRIKRRTYTIWSVGDSFQWNKSFEVCS